MAEASGNTRVAEGSLVAIIADEVRAQGQAESLAGRGVRRSVSGVRGFGVGL
jgi:hypothetical protein